MRPLSLFDVSPHDQLVTGDDGMAEAQFVDAWERDEAAVFFRIEQGYAADWAMASAMGTPGMTSFPGNGHWKNCSSKVAFLMPMAYFISSSSMMRSTSSSGIAMRQNFHNISYFQKS